MGGIISLRERYEKFYGTNFEDAVKNNPYDEDEIPWSVHDDSVIPEIIDNYHTAMEECRRGETIDHDDIDWE